MRILKQMPSVVELEQYKMYHEFYKRVLINGTYNKYIQYTRG